MGETMTRETPAARVRWATVLDGQGRHLFVPWHPFSRTAYVLPDAGAHAELAKRVRRYLILGAGVFLLALVLTAPVRIPWWTSYPVAALLLLHWHWWSRRAARGLERTRYERPT